MKWPMILCVIYISASGVLVILGLRLAVMAAIAGRAVAGDRYLRGPGRIGHGGHGDEVIAALAG